MKDHLDFKKQQVFYVVFVYVLMGGLWVLISDQLLPLLPHFHAAFAVHLQTLKGFGFVAITSWLLNQLLPPFYSSLETDDRSLPESDWEQTCSHLRETVEQQINELTAFYQITAPMTAVSTSQEWLTLWLERVTQVAQADLAVVWIEDDDRLRIQAGSGGISEEFSQLSIPLQQSFLGAIASRKQPFYLADIHDREIEVHAQELSCWQKQSICSVVGVPLLDGDRAIGVLQVGWAERQSPHDCLLSLLEIAAGHCTLALVNLRLSHQVQILNAIIAAQNHSASESKASVIQDDPVKSQWVADLQRAIAEDEFELHYQPIVMLSNSRITGFEALIRWQHPERGLVMPGDFIPIAEETDLILPIGEWVLEKACQQAKDWQNRFPCQPPLTMSVNLSSKQFNQPDLVKQIHQVLCKTQLAPATLRLEITETAVMQDAKAATVMLNKLHDMGVKLSIDDFGTGYSSLGYLYRFPVDSLKVDRSFISRIDVDGEQVELVRTVLMLAWNLGLDTVAEGVESSKQLAQLRALQCEYGQGYFFNKPLPHEAIEAILIDRLRL